MDINDLKERTRQVKGIALRNAVLTYLDYHRVLIENVPASLRDHYCGTGGLLF
jgi:hypothetical protein